MFYIYSLPDDFTKLSGATGHYASEFFFPCERPQSRFLHIPPLHPSKWPLDKVSTSSTVETEEEEEVEEEEVEEEEEEEEGGETVPSRKSGSDNEDVQ